MYSLYMLPVYLCLQHFLLSALVAQKHCIKAASELLFAHSHRVAVTRNPYAWLMTEPHQSCRSVAISTCDTCTQHAFPSLGHTFRNSKSLTKPCHLPFAALHTLAPQAGNPGSRLNPEHAQRLAKHAAVSTLRYQSQASVCSHSQAAAGSLKAEAVGNEQQIWRFRRLAWSNWLDIGQQAVPSGALGSICATCQCSVFSLRCLAAWHAGSSYFHFSCRLLTRALKTSRKGNSIGQQNKQTMELHPLHISKA